MTALERRMNKLEQSRSCGVKDLTDEELEAKIRALDADPYIQALLADDSNSDPMRLAILRLNVKEASLQACAYLTALGHGDRLS